MYMLPKQHYCKVELNVHVQNKTGVANIWRESVYCSILLQHGATSCLAGSIVKTIVTCIVHDITLIQFIPKKVTTPLLVAMKTY